MLKPRVCIRVLEIYVRKFCAKNPVRGDGSREDFPDEDILTIELRTWRCTSMEQSINMGMG